MNAPQIKEMTMTNQKFIDITNTIRLIGETGMDPNRHPEDNNYTKREEKIISVLKTVRKCESAIMFEVCEGLPYISIIPLGRIDLDDENYKILSNDWPLGEPLYNLIVHHLNLVSIDK